MSFSPRAFGAGVFALSGACCLAPYFDTLPSPLMTVVYWNLF